MQLLNFLHKTKQLQQQTKPQPSKLLSHTLVQKFSLLRMRQHNMLQQLQLPLMHYLKKKSHGLK